MRRFSVDHALHLIMSPVHERSLVGFRHPVRTLPFFKNCTAEDAVAAARAEDRFLESVKAYVAALDVRHDMFLIEHSMRYSVRIVECLVNQCGIQPRQIVVMMRYEPKSLDTTHYAKYSVRHFCAQNGVKQFMDRVFL